MFNIKRKIKQFITKMVEQKQVSVIVSLKCPDGLCESLGYNLPKEIDSFIEFINGYSGKKDYTITLEKFNVLEAIAKLEKP